MEASSTTLHLCAYANESDNLARVEVIVADHLVRFSGDEASQVM
jgi:hypothetical protein